MSSKALELLSIIPVYPLESSATELAECLGTDAKHLTFTINSLDSEFLLAQDLRTDSDGKPHMMFTFLTEKDKLAAIELAGKIKPRGIRRGRTA